MNRAPTQFQENRIEFMLTRRHFLYALTGGLFALGGCKGRKNDSEQALPPISIKTVIDPATAAASPQITRFPVRFADVSQSAGLRWTYQNGATGRHILPEDTAGGVAFLDYNNDGLLDIFAPQAGPIPDATGAEANFPKRNVLYRNNGDGTFSDVTEGSGLETIPGYGQGVSVADYDNDGWMDLYVTAIGGNHLFRNNRNGTFTDVTEKAGVADKDSLGHPGEAPWPLSSAWGDYDNDGHLDLFVCHYCRWTRALNHDCKSASGQLSYCRPQVYEPSHCRLYHNNGDGTFSDVTVSSGVGRLWGKSMSAAWLDYDDDGWMDLFVTNDTMPNFLLHNNRDGTFANKGTVAGVAFSEQGEAVSGMGIGIADYLNEGRPDLFAVNFSGQAKSVFHNLGHGIFESESSQSGIASTNLQYLGFGLECFDYDLDGWQDLVVGNGHVLGEADAHNDSSTFAQSQQLFHNSHNGTFAEDPHSLGDLALPRVTRGLAVGDFDNDGDQDVIMVSQTGPLQLFRNDGGNRNHWVTLRLEGVTCNRDAVGAKVTLHASGGPQTQWVRGGSSFASHSDTRLTFGLAEAAGVLSGTVRWPGGKTQAFGPLAAGAFYWLRQGQAPVPDPRVKAKKAP